MNTQYSGGDARVLLTLVRRLADAIEAAIAGQVPSKAEWDAAPVLSAWEAAADVRPVLRGVVRCAGADRAQLTGEVLLFAPRAGWARTLDGLYRLGASARDVDEAQ